MNETFMLLNDLINFQLVVFGFSATLFTVLYALVISEKEKLISVSSEIKLGHINPKQIREEQRSIKILKTFKSINKSVITMLITSFLSYLACVSVKHLSFFHIYLKGLTFGLSLVTLGIVLLMVIILVKSIISYNKLSKT